MAGQARPIPAVMSALQEGVSGFDTSQHDPGIERDLE